MSTPIVLAVVPTRGRSSSIKRKNLQPLAGNPLLSYTINSARKSNFITHLIVSTDDDEIYEYCDSLGVIIVRHPPNLSVDNAPSFFVVKWLLNAFRRVEDPPKVVVVLKATSPLRAAKDIDNAIQMLLTNDDADSVVSVSRNQNIHPSRFRCIVDGMWLFDACESEGNFPKKRDENGVLYCRNDAIYAARPSLITQDCLWGSRCLAYVMPEERSVCIYSLLDLKIAELIMRDSDLPGLFGSK